MSKYFTTTEGEKIYYTTESPESGHCASQPDNDDRDTLMNSPSPPSSQSADRSSLKIQITMPNEEPSKSNQSASNASQRQGLLQRAKPSSWRSHSRSEYSSDTVHSTASHLQPSRQTDIDRAPNSPPPKSEFLSAEDFVLQELSRLRVSSSPKARRDRKRGSEILRSGHSGISKKSKNTRPEVPWPPKR